MAGREAVLRSFALRSRLQPAEALPWLAIIACYFLFPDYLALGAQVLATILFALSLDLILGYAGMVTLGHAAFFGIGAYVAGLLNVHGWPEPLSGLLVAALAGGLVGLLTGLVIIRTRALTFLMLTLVVATMLGEVANKWTSLTGGADGLPGMQVASVLGFRFDFFGRTAYVYCGAILFIAWLLVRRLVHSPFGRSLTGIRENIARMHAIGAPVTQRLLASYVISASLAGVAGALATQTTQFVGLNAFSLDRSGTLLVMLIIGGVGRLYGAFIGVPLYMIFQDRFSSIDPIYWYFWMGLMLVLIVVFAPGGVFGLIDRTRAWVRTVR